MSVLFENIKNLGIKNKLTIYDIASIVNITPQTLYNWNKSTNNVRINNVEQVAKALNTSPSYLLGWDIEDDNKKQTFELSTINTNNIKYKGVTLTDKEKKILTNILDVIREQEE